MSLRTSDAAARRLGRWALIVTTAASIAMLAACGPSASQEVSIPCALHGSPAWHEDCRVEREASAESIILTLRHPDGGFRRLTLGRDGWDLVTADGADPVVVVRQSADHVGLRVVDDRYRLPASLGEMTKSAP